MKIGICADVNQIAQLREGAADYAELNLVQLYNMTDQELKKSADVLSDCGISAEAANGFMPGEIRLCGQLYDKNKLKDYCEKALYNAASIGIHTCVLGSGKARNIDDNENRENCINQLEEAFCVVGDVARKFNTTIVIEPLNKNETNVINTVRDGATMCRKLNHPNIMLLGDTYHMAQENESFEVFADNGDILRHIHIASPEGRLYPAKNDGFDYSMIKTALDKAKYDLRISIEGILLGEFKESAEKSLEFLKSVFC